MASMVVANMLSAVLYFVVNRGTAGLKISRIALPITAMRGTRQVTGTPQPPPPHTHTETQTHCASRPPAPPHPRAQRW